jgi:diguanylate cyclase (GGDEF)-like protein/PAS domain S-box-containing protein
MRLAFAAIKNTTEGVAVISPDGLIVECNPAFTRITGYVQDAAVNLPWSDLVSNRQGERVFSHLFNELQTKGQWEGELWSRRSDGTEFLQRCTVDAVRDGQGNVTHFVSVFNDITESYHKDQQLIHQALHDPLTGLGNRSLLADRLEQGISLAERNHVQLGLLYIDLDQFKTVNDTLGHHVGDLLLKSVAHRISSSLRSSDTLARVGGDEFVVVMNEIHSAVDCATLASKLINNFHDHFLIQDLRLHAQGSIGIAVYPEDGKDAATLMKNADIALYAAKDSGRNTYAFFDPELALLAQRRLEMEQALRESLTAQEFSLVYQPKVDSRSGRLLGLEALMRWHCAKLGETPPNIFIPVAEESGLIEQLGEWAIGEVCRQIAQWQQGGHDWRSVAINISTRQLLTKNLPELFRRQTGHYAIDPHFIEVEVTESFVMENFRQSMPVLQDLRKMGIRIAIDDFGTGHASLAYLRELPADILKIDQYFTRELLSDPVMREIVATIVAMAHTLGLRVIAEGVETHDQAELLREIGCDELQGYLFARPLPPEQIDFSVLDWFAGV